MTEFKHEIGSEITKVYKTRFQFTIEKFLLKMNVVSHLDIDIPGLTTCHLEVHPNFRKTSNSSKYTKLVFRLGGPQRRSDQPRQVKLNIRTSVDICIWHDEFSYDNPVERSMEDFLNQIYLRGYLESGNLILNGIIHVRELDWKEANESVVLREDRHFNLVRDLHSLIESGMLIDFTFIVSGREMEVHKAILAARSPVFERMFNGNFRESSADREEIKDISIETFDEFLHFIYTGSLRNEDYPVVELMIVADRYEVQDLLKVCELKLLNSIDSDNAESIFRLASTIQCNTELKKVAFDVIQSIFTRFTIALPDDFIDCPDKVYKIIAMKRNLEKALKLEAIDDITNESEILIDSNLSVNTEELLGSVVSDEAFKLSTSSQETRMEPFSNVNKEKSSSSVITSDSAASAPFTLSSVSLSDNEICHTFP